MHLSTNLILAALASGALARRPRARSNSAGPATVTVTYIPDYCKTLMPSVTTATCIKCSTFLETLTLPPATSGEPSTTITRTTSSSITTPDVTTPIPIVTPTVTPPPQTTTIAPPPVTTTAEPVTTSTSVIVPTTETTTETQPPTTSVVVPTLPTETTPLIPTIIPNGASTGSASLALISIPLIMTFF